MPAFSGMSSPGSEKTHVVPSSGKVSLGGVSALCGLSSLLPAVLLCAGCVLLRELLATLECPMTHD